MSSIDDVRDELFSSIDQMLFRNNKKMTRDEQLQIVDAYFELFDVNALIKRNNDARNNQKFDFVYSRMHAQSFVVMNMHDA